VSLDPWQKKVDLFRSRFVCRQDIFYIRTSHPVQVVDKVTGETRIEDKASAMPSCSNYGNQKLCLITQKKGGCSECSHRVYKSVTDEEVWKHISGEHEMILISLREEGIRFGAADFDKGHVFEDAKAVRDLSVSYGIPCYIAKSTKKGYHVYWFFSDFVKPHEFTSYIRHLFEELGFYQRYQITPEVGLPEVFPKQTLFSDQKIGNGIKVPMMEPRMKEGRNCWVDDEANPIPLDRQWGYFENTQSTLPSDFARILEEQKVEILQAPANRSYQKARVDEGKAMGPASKPKPFGSFWNVVESCPALREYWERDADGNYLWDKTNPDGKLIYDAWMASLMVAIHTTDGVEIIKKRWPDRDTDYQVRYAIENGYSPMTCKTMQEKGVCRVGRHPRFNDHCMKKLPPVEYAEGKRIENPEGLPESQWPEPSPIRYATDRNLTADEIIEKLSGIFKVLKAKTKDKKAGELPPLIGDPQVRIQGLWHRAFFLPEDDYKRIKAHVTQNKWMTATEIKALEKTFKKEAGDKKDEELRKGGVPTFTFNGSEFYLKDGRYLRVWRDQKGNRMQEELTNFYILMNEECIALRMNDTDDLSKLSVAEDRSFKGTIFVDNERIIFDVNYREWTTSSDTFFKALTQIAGGRCLYNRGSYDHIRNCIYTFSKEHCVTKKVTRQIGHHMLKERGVYIMPSVIVDKDSIRTNDEFSVEPFRDDVAKGLDFKVISDDEFKDLARHIVDDLFACNNATLTMTTFAHAMASTLIPQITAAAGWSKGPVLWLAGSQSGGKSFVAELVQHFFGNFSAVQSASGTSKSKLGQGYNFRHAFMLIDDYKKHLVDPFGKEFPQLVQNAYDRSGRTALQRDGQPRAKVDRIRGLIAITGEDTIETQASSLSRMILVDVPFRENRDAGGRCLKRRNDYCGFTPYFIKFCLNMSTEEIAGLWAHYYKEFFDPIAETFKKASPSRVCENLTLNMVAFHLSMEMMAAYGAIPEVRRDELIRMHFENLKMVRSKIFEVVQAATGARIFLEGLKELLQNPAKCMIWNWPDYEGDHNSVQSTQVGFWRKGEPDVAYIYPQVAHGLVSEFCRKSGNSVQAIPHVARDLFEEGHMDQEKVRRDKGGFVVHVRGPNGTSVRAWPIKLSALGFETPKPKGNQKPKTYHESDGNQPTLNVVSLDKAK
jgi:hypothetical protein